MRKTVLQQIDALGRMPTTQLRKRWVDLFGSEPGRLGRNHLIRRLAYRVQELAYGGLSAESRTRLAAIGRGESDARAKSQRTPLQVGTRLVREWRGQRYEVTVQEDGFLYAGKRYRTLSAVARAITGSHWSGNRFFGLSAQPRHRKGKA